MADSPRPLSRVAVWSAYASGIASIFGIVLLIAFFTLGDPFGRANDIAVIVQYSLMLPIAFALHQILRRYNLRLSLAALLVGIPGMLAVIVLQVLLVTGTIPFSTQIGLVVIAFLVVLLWFIAIGYQARFTGVLPQSMLLHVLAGLYIAYPVWAFMTASRLTSAGEHVPPAGASQTQNN